MRSSSIDDDDERSAVDRERLHAAIERSFVAIDARMTAPFDDVIALLHGAVSARS